MKKYSIGVLVCIVVCALAPFAAYAKVTANTLSLCQYYVQPTSTIVPLSADLTEVTKGGRIAFRGEVIHNGSVPLVDVTVYVKVVSLVESRVVALLPATLELPLAPGTHTPFDVVWDVPATLSPGSYAAESVVYVNGRHALKSTFNQDLLSPYEFTVAGEPPESIRFNLDGVLVNGGAPDGISGVVRAPQDGSLTVSVPITNDTQNPLEADARWTIYAWDGPRSDRLIGTVHSEVKAHPRTTGMTTFGITDTSQPDYFVEGVLNIHGEPLTVYMHISRLGHRSIMLTAGGAERSSDDGTWAAYACVVSPDAPSDDVRLLLSMRPTLFGIPYGSDEVVFVGSVPQGAEYALAAPLREVKGNVIARLYHGDELIDTLAVSYGGSGGESGGLIVGLVVLIALIVAGWVRFRLNSK